MTIALPADPWCQPRIVLDLHRGNARSASADLPLSVGSDQTLACAGTRWDLAVAEASGHLAMTATLAAGDASGPALGLDLHFPAWSTAVYTLLPGAVYAGNRFPAVAMGYPPMAPPMPPTARDQLPRITDIPRLGLPAGGRIELLSSDAAAPCLGLYDPATGRGLLLWVPLFHRGLRPALSITEAADGRSAVIGVRWPGLRHGTRYTMGCTTSPSTEVLPDLAVGGTLDLAVTVETFPCQGIAALFDRVDRIREDLIPRQPVVPQAPLSAVAGIIRAKHAAEDWREDLGCFAPEQGGYFTCTNGAAGASYVWQAGWTGGGATALAMLASDDAELRRRAVRNLSLMTGPGQASSGFFHSYLAVDGRTWGDHTHHPEAPWHLIRRSADALFHLAGAIALVRDRDGVAAIPADWQVGLVRAADALVRLWQRHGQLGMYVDITREEIVCAGTAGGALVPAALLRAADLHPGTGWREAAVAIADQHYQLFVAAGWSNGGPGDVAQGPESESAFALVESAVAVAEWTGEARWWLRAQEAAALAASWVFPGDYPFSSSSTFGRLGIRSTGGIMASVQNRCGVPGICTLSGQGLLRLYRATGDRRHLALLRDIVTCLPQLVSRADRPIPVGFRYDGTPVQGEVQPPGWMCERITITEWHVDPIGEVFRYSCWSEVATLLTATELPGVVVDRTRGEVTVLDDLVATLEGDVLVLTNPTAFPAVVSVLAEDAAARAVPWSPAPIRDLPRVAVAAGATVRVSLE